MPDDIYTGNSYSITCAIPTQASIGTTHLTASTDPSC